MTLKGKTPNLALSLLSLQLKRLPRKIQLLSLLLRVDLIPIISPMTK